MELQKNQKMRKTKQECSQKIQKILVVIMTIVIFGGLITANIILSSGEEIEDMFRQILCMILANVGMFAGGWLIYHLIKRREDKTKNKDMKYYSGSAGYHWSIYHIPAISLLCVLVLGGGLIYNWEEFWSANQFKDVVFGMVVLAVMLVIGIYSLYYFSSCRLLYSRYGIMLKRPFHQKCIWNWGELREISIFQKKKKEAEYVRFVTKDGREVEIHSGSYYQGWEGFRTVLLQVCEEFGIERNMK